MLVCMPAVTLAELPGRPCPIAAALELVREGEVELHQKEAFAPLYFRKRPPQPAPDPMTAPDLQAE